MEVVNYLSYMLNLLPLRKVNFMILITIVALSSCDNDEVFEKEQYKNVFALISGSENISYKFHSLGKESTGIVAASVGGTNPTEKDIVVNLVEDPSLIHNYNIINYDVDKTKYARALPKGNYDINSFQFTIPAGEISGRLPIEIRPDGLSPDSTYFIPLRIDSHSAYEANPTKSYILYEIRTKNWWALSDGSTIYNMTAILSEVGDTYELQMPGTKVMQPISENQVRMMPGNEKYESEKIVFDQQAIILTIEDDNKVTISPYKNAEVTQIDGDEFYSNTFFIEDDGFKTYKTFRLRYIYKSGGNRNYEIKEELRLQYDEDEDEED